MKHTMTVYRWTRSRGFKKAGVHRDVQQVRLTGNRCKTEEQRKSAEHKKTSLLAKEPAKKNTKR